MQRIQFLQEWQRYWIRIGTVSYTHLDVYKRQPETPTPETPGTTTKTSNPPKTGDTANAILWIAILVLSAAGITGVRIWNKKKQVKRLGTVSYTHLDVYKRQYYATYYF